MAKVKNRLQWFPIQCKPSYQRDYSLLFISPNTTLTLLGGYIEGLRESEVFGFKCIEQYMGTMEDFTDSWELLNGLDHFLTLGWVMQVNDHSQCALEHRLYAKC